MRGLMRKKKLKNILLNDYITIISAKNFYSFCLNNIILNENEISSIKLLSDFSNELLNTYKKIMFRLGLIDLSLAILDKDINFLNRINNEFFSNKAWLLAKIYDFSNILQYIATTLKSKIKKLGLNNFELNYLKINKLNEFALQTKINP